VKILHVITGLSTGGAERALYNLLASCAQEAEHCVLSLQCEGTFGPQIRALGIPVYGLGMRGWLGYPKAIWRLSKITRGFRPDIIQGWMYHGNLAASVASWMAPGSQPVVAWNIRHSLYRLAAERPVTRKVIRANRWLSGGVNAVIYNSQLSRRQHERFGLASSRGKVIPNGFDTDKWRPDDECRRVTRNSLNIPSSAIVVGHVARFHPMKDHASFLRAASEVMQRHKNMVCLLVGRQVDLSNPALVNIVPPEIEDRFRFVGERSDVEDMMRAMDVFCQSSWSEAFPNVLGEAMSLGVPCVATDVGDSRDILGETGKIVPPLDTSALTDGLLTLLDLSPDQRAALGHAARSRIKGRYDLPKMAEDYLALYKGLVPGRW
jgi:glycosyltransferase involved in cell wall biosynthesis